MEFRVTRNCIRRELGVSMKKKHVDYLKSLMDTSYRYNFFVTFFIFQKELCALHLVHVFWDEILGHYLGMMSQNFGMKIYYDFLCNFFLMHIKTQKRLLVFIYKNHSKLFFFFCLQKKYKMEMKFWAILGRRGCREKKISQLP